MPATDDDWRLVRWQKFLLGVPLHWCTYIQRAPNWDHDHCSFCWAKFMEEGHPETLHAGYATADRHHWICPTCYEDFRERFRWTIADAA